MLNKILVDLAKLLNNSSLLTPLIALVAGFLTSLTPCSLSSIPLIMGYVKGSGEENRSKSFRLSLIFVLGMSITFIGIGVVSSLLGRLVGLVPSYIYLGVGILMIMMAIQSWGIYYFIKPNNLLNKSTKKNSIGAFISGLLAGFFASPCTTPVMIALISLVISSSNLSILWGIFLFVMFAIGHSIVTLLAGTWSVGLNELMVKKGYKNLAKVVEGILGLLIFALGVYFLSLGI